MLTYVKLAHPVKKFVPSDVPIEKLALLGAATDWYVYVKPSAFSHGVLMNV